MKETTGYLTIVYICPYCDMVCSLNQDHIDGDGIAECDYCDEEVQLIPE